MGFVPVCLVWGWATWEVAFVNCTRRFLEMCFLTTVITGAMNKYIVLNISDNTLYQFDSYSSSIIKYGRLLEFYWVVLGFCTTDKTPTCSCAVTHMK